MVRVDVMVEVNFIMSVNVVVGLGVKLGVSVYKAAVSAACSSGEGPQAVSKDNAFNMMNTRFLI